MAAQRVLYSNANSNAILNGSVYQMTAEASFEKDKAIGSFWGGVQVVKPVFTGAFADVSDIAIVSADEIPGVNMSESGELLGTPTEAGDYVVNAKAIVEGWVYVRLTLTIHIN